MDPLFAVPTGRRNFWSIIRWWESRRWAYNFIVLSVGFCSFLLYCFFLIKSGELKPGEDAEEPMALFAIPFLLNFCYCFGALVELVLFWFSARRTRNVGPLLLRIGLTFSLVMAMLPAVAWGLIWLFRVL